MDEFLKSVFEAESVPHVLTLGSMEWIRHHAASVEHVGPVWATVTARERWYYHALLAEACPGCEVPQPSAADVFQTVGAGAMRGLVWAIGKDDAHFELSQEAAEALFDSLATAEAAEAAHADAVAWLEGTILPPLGAPASEAARAAMATYAALFAELASPPTYCEQENLACDGASPRMPDGARVAAPPSHPALATCRRAAGTKLLMGLQSRRRRGYFRDPNGGEFGELAAPRRVLMLRPNGGGGGGEATFRAEWLDLPGVPGRRRTRRGRGALS